MRKPIKKLKISEAEKCVQGMAIGLRKGHVTTKFVSAKPRPSKTGRVSKHNKLVKEIIRDVVGFLPYERRGMELLRAGKDKRTLKFLKKRLGGHSKARKKRDQLQTLIQLQKK